MFGFSVSFSVFQCTRSLIPRVHFVMLERLRFYIFVLFVQYNNNRHLRVFLVPKESQEMSRKNTVKNDDIRRAADIYAVFLRCRIRQNLELSMSINDL